MGMGLIELHNKNFDQFMCLFETDPLSDPSPSGSGLFYGLGPHADI